jgi:tRNA nucleotidyltransferase/poly(A) polymerase
LFILPTNQEHLVPKLPAFSFLAEHGGADLLITGGAARDFHLGQNPHELHLVLRGVPLRTLELFFARRGRTERHDHGLYVQPRGTTGLIDVSLPRTDIYHPREKTMVYQFHHSLPPSNDANWRDVSMNAMAYSVREGTFSDPYRGEHALERRPPPYRP